jgi:O-antigen/teichoic acid export membrane protein
MRTEAAPPVDRPTPISGTSRRTLLLAFRSSAAAAVVTYAFNLAIVPFVLGRLGVELYGAWATVASILAVGALADAGVRTEIIRRVGSAKGADDDGALVESVRQGVTLLVVLASAVALVGFLGAPAVRAFAFPDGVPGYTPSAVDQLLRTTVALLAVSLVANGYFGVLRGIQRGDVETGGRLVAVPAAAAMTVAGVALSWGLWALFLGSLTQFAVTTAWNVAGTRRLVPGLRLRLVALSGPVVKSYLAFSGLVLLSQIGDVVDSQWDKLVISRFVGSAAVASYQIGTTLVLQGKALAVLPLMPLLVAVAELRHRDGPRTDRLFSTLARTGMAVAAVVLGAVFVFAPSFLRVWLGPNEAAVGAGEVARLFTLAVAFNLVSAPFAFRALGEGWHALCAFASVANMVVNGALSLVLTMVIGLHGALYGSIVGNLTGSALFFVLLRRRAGPTWPPPPWRALAVGASAAAVAVAAGLDGVASLPSLLLAGTGYLVVTGALCTRAEGLHPRQLLSPRGGST